MAEGVDAGLLSLLEELKISCTHVSHEAAFTVEEQAKLVDCSNGAKLTKNLFVKDKKHGMFLITAEHTTEVNMKTVASMLGLVGANLRFADEAALMESLGVIKGAVSPFALINDKECKVKFCLDKSLLDSPLINIHPLRNDRTTTLSPAALSTFVTATKHTITPLDFASQPATTAPSSSGDAKAKKEVKKDAPKAAAGAGAGTENDGGTKLGISAKKDEDFGNWYTQTLLLSEMIDYSDISGCYILRPWSFFIWEQIQEYMDKEIKSYGVKNTYFPMFVSKKQLETEKDHIEGFAPEVAWVTKSGDKDLVEPIAVRPTSETIMYPFFAKWIRSHRDLPFEINQWCNVVRWEFKDATPFLRSREFLWQEGHTAHCSYEEAQRRVLIILDMYARVYEELLAVPVIKGMKTEKEKFAGACHTTTVEAYINGSGRAIQGATSHNLGQNFGKMFKMCYEDEKGEKQIPWQTSWGFTTRSIGVCVMVHGDDKGLVLPPRIAPTQVIIVSIVDKDPVATKALEDYCDVLKHKLKAAGIRADTDLRSNYTPGWKYNHWEQKGVPIRIEVGKRDLEGNKYRSVRRDTGAKEDLPVETADADMTSMLAAIQKNLLETAKKGRDEKVVQVTTWAEFVPALEKKCMVLTPFCDEEEWEDVVKKRSREESGGGDEAETTATSCAAKTLCKPFEQLPMAPGTLCFISGKPATTWVLWGRSY